jgi:hypothetical protein
MVNLSSRIINIRQKIISIRKRTQWLVTCISGNMPFPKIAAIMEMAVKALKALDDFLGSKE